MLASHPVIGATALLEATELNKSFLLRRQSDIHAVRDVSFRMDAAECVGLVGESGCGKSTLGRIIAGLEQADSGTLSFDGEEIAGIIGPTRIQMVFQDPLGSLDPRMTVGESIEEPLGIYRRADRRPKVLAALEMVGLSQNYATRRPHEISGGQVQRVAIARALVTKPALLILDEPVTALDVSVQAQILRLLYEIQRDSDVAMLFVAHDLAVVQALCSRVLVMYLGQLVEDAPVSAFARRPLHPYSVALRDAIPRPDPRHERTRSRVTLKDDVEEFRNPMDNACVFAARCPAVQPICRERRPALVESESEHYVACHFPGVVSSDSGSVPEQQL